MISPSAFYHALKNNQCAQFYGVPDSTLKHFCAYLTANALSGEHTICVNEGAAIAMACGYHMATGEVPVVYMQNSGLGNCVNPLTSLAAGEVYAFPMLLVIGWRGAPGEKDEPQHALTGQITTSLLDIMNIPWQIVDKQCNDFEDIITHSVQDAKSLSSPVAIVIKKGTFSAYEKPHLDKETHYPLTRETAIQIIVEYSKKDSIIIATTGMASRELFECRALYKQSHKTDFLTIGGMGFAASIALAIAQAKPDKHIICIDGDGAALMHMGTLANIGVSQAKNYTHIVINNGVHDSVGGQATLSREIELNLVAKACGYSETFKTETASGFRQILEHTHATSGPRFIEVWVRTGHRSDLGRPTTTPIDNKKQFVRNLHD